MNCEKIEKIFTGREERAEVQNELIKKNQSTLISFTINVPGLEKNNEKVKKIFKKGIKEIKNALDINNILILEEKVNSGKISGPEAFFAVDKEANKIKKITVEIERTPIGRLYDIDVFSKEGISISRKNLGYKERTCIICGDNAKTCTRSQRHEQEEVLDKFYSIYTDFIDGN